MGHENNLLFLVWIIWHYCICMLLKRHCSNTFHLMWNIFMFVLHENPPNALLKNVLHKNASNKNVCYQWAVGWLCVSCLNAKHFATWIMNIFPLFCAKYYFKLHRSMAGMACPWNGGSNLNKTWRTYYKLSNIYMRIHMQRAYIILYACKWPWKRQNPHKIVLQFYTVVFCSASSLRSSYGKVIFPHPLLIIYCVKLANGITFSDWNRKKSRIKLDERMAHEEFQYASFSISEVIIDLNVKLETCQT